jgi:hypothetical protein
MLALCPASASSRWMSWTERLRVRIATTRARMRSHTGAVDGPWARAAKKRVRKSRS